MASFFKEILPEWFNLIKLQMKLSELIPSAKKRVEIINRFKKISDNVDCPHNDTHILSFVVSLLSVADKSSGCIVEAGAYKGGSTAKLSIIAEYLGLKLKVYDSFEGLPENSEEHDKSIFGYSIKGWFDGEKFSGSLDEVKSNIEKFGNIDVCSFHKGWFDKTMLDFEGDVLAAYVDVDLAESTKTCIKYLYPKIVPGGIFCSQDGDFPLVIDVFKDDKFWEEEVGCTRPEIQGLDKSKMLIIKKSV